jgi:hypothetical protein
MHALKPLSLYFTVAYPNDLSSKILSFSNPPFCNCFPVKYSCFFLFLCPEGAECLVTGARRNIVVSLLATRRNHPSFLCLQPCIGCTNPHQTRHFFILFVKKKKEKEHTDHCQ